MEPLHAPSICTDRRLSGRQPGGMHLALRARFREDRCGNVRLAASRQSHVFRSRVVQSGMEIDWKPDSLLGGDAVSERPFAESDGGASVMAPEDRIAAKGSTRRRCCDLIRPVESSTRVGKRACATSGRHRRWQGESSARLSPMAGPGSSRRSRGDTYVCLGPSSSSVMMNSSIGDDARDDV
jgi:hypothetical protein